MHIDIQITTKTVFSAYCEKTKNEKTRKENHSHSFLNYVFFCNVAHLDRFFIVTQKGRGLLNNQINVLF